MNTAYFHIPKEIWKLKSFWNFTKEQKSKFCNQTWCYFICWTGNLGKAKNNSPKKIIKNIYFIIFHVITALQTEKSLRTIFTLYLKSCSYLIPWDWDLGTLSTEISSTLVAGLVLVPKLWIETFKCEFVMGICYGFLAKILNSVHHNTIIDILYTALWEGGGRLCFILTCISTKTITV